MVGTHFTFNGNYCSVGVCDSLMLCNLTYETFAVFCETYDRRSSSCALGVRNNHGFTAFENGYARVCSTQIYTNNLTHNI